MSGLRPSPRVRAERLEEEIGRRELEERRKGLSAPERAWERAIELAPAREIEELERLEALYETQEPYTWAMVETLQRMRELKERIMYRSEPVLAAYYRAQRCLLLWVLKGLEQRAIEADESWGSSSQPGHTGGSDAEAGIALHEALVQSSRRRYGLGTAVINRNHAVQSGVEPITDAQEAERLANEVLEAVDAGDRDRVLRLVGRI